MLRVVTLVAWSAASVAFATPEDIMSSGNDSSPWDTTHTPIAATADMETSAYNDNAEERAIVVPQEIDSVLARWHLSMLTDLSEEEQKAKLNELTPRIKLMNEKFSALTREKENGFIRPGSFVEKLVNFGMRTYMKTSVEVSNAMLVMLAHDFQGDDLISALVTAQREATRKHILGKMIDLQIREWENSARDPAECFELLQLHKAKGNPIIEPLFDKWAYFVESSNRGYPENAYKQILSVLAEHFNNNEFALESALVEGTKVQGIKVLIKKVLIYQIKLWGEAKSQDPERVFTLLELQQIKDELFESALFRAWVSFMKLRYEENYEAKMFDILKSYYNTEELARVLVAGTKTRNMIKVGMKMLNLQVEELARKGTSEKEVFELLQIHLADGNPQERPLFSIWQHFLKRDSTWEDAEMKQFTFLTGYFKGDDLTNILVAATRIDSTKVSAKQILNSQIDVWVEEERDVTEVFELLELHKTTDSLFASPAFSTWVEFVRSKFSDDLEATEMMISTLRAVYADDLTRILAVGAEVDGMKSVAKTLQKALNQELPNAPKRKNIDLGSSSQKRQKIGLNKPHSPDIDLNKPHSPDIDLNKPHSPDIDLNEPLLPEIGLEPPPLKRQKSFDLNKRYSPDTETNLSLHPRED